MAVIICKQIRKAMGGYIIELDMPLTAVVWSDGLYPLKPQGESISCEVVCKTWEEVMSRLTELKDEAGVKDDD